MLTIGLLFFLAKNWHSDKDRLIIINNGLIDERIRLWEIRNGVTSNASQQQAIVEQLIQDQVLVQEALSMGFDQLATVQARLKQLSEPLTAGYDGPAAQRIRESLTEQALNADTTIHNYLINGLEKQLKASIAVESPSEQAIQQYFQENSTRFSHPPRRSLYQVFNAADTTPVELEQRVQQLKSEKLHPKEAYKIGEPSINGYQFVQISEQQLADKLGKAFAERAFKARLGEWSAPISSAHGLHIIWVDEELPAQPQNLNRVRDRIVQLLARDDYEQQRLASIRRISEKYRVLLPEPYLTPAIYRQ